MNTELQQKNDNLEAENKRLEDKIVYFRQKQGDAGDAAAGAGAAESAQLLNFPQENVSKYETY